MIDRFFQKVPWWAAALAMHVVLLVQAMTFGARPPFRDTDGTQVELAAGRDLDLHLQAPDVPEFGPQPSMKPHEPEEEIVFRDVDEEGLDDGFF